MLLIFAGVEAGAQLPDSCKPPASATHAPAGTSPARVYDVEGAWFAGKGQLKCAAAAFQHALELEPKSAEAHFDLGLVRQSQKQEAAAIEEFRLALRYDPGLLPARCALGLALSDPAEAEVEFRKALDQDSNSVCALDGLAQLLLTGGRYDAALTYWRHAVQLQPEDMDLQLSLATGTYKAAKARQAAGLPDEEGSRVADAVQLFTKLLKSHPEMTAAHFTLANIYANEGRYREAADEYREVVNRNPADTQSLFAEAKALLNVTAYTDALAPAKDYVRRKPNDPAGRVLLGMVYRGLGDYTKAEPELELGAAKEPDDFDAQYQLGFVLAHLGKRQQALPVLRRAVALKPEEKSAQFQLAALLRELGQEQEAAEIVEQVRKTTGNDFQKSQVTAEGIKANDLLQARRPAEAAEIYRRMLEENPHNAWTAYNLALALEAMKNLKGAEDELLRAVGIDSKLAKPRAELGRLRLTAGDLPGAEKWLESALELDPQSAEARGDLAMVRAKEGDLVVAEKLLRQALEDDPNYTEGHLGLGLILAQQGKTFDAEQELDKAAALAPQDPATLSAVGKAKAQLGDMASGIALLRKVVELAPGLAAAHLDLALALADSYDLPGALVEAGEAVRLAPQSGVAHFNRGRILFDLDRGQEAKAELETAYRLIPQMAEPRYFLALIDKQEGNLTVAATLLEETVKLEPRNAMAWYLLGQCFEKQAETTKAIDAWRQAIAIDPKFSQALFGLGRALRSTEPSESQQLLARYAAIQKERQILDQAGTLANNGVVAASAHDWPEATRQLKEAIAECGDCLAKADLHKKLGLIECSSGELENGERELLIADRLKPADPEIQRVLKMIAQAKSVRSESAAGKVY